MSMRYETTLVIALMTAGAVALFGCGDDSDGGVPSTGVNLSQAAPAHFVAHASVEQIYVTDATPGTPLKLVRPDGSVVRTAAADDEGTLIFRDLSPMASYAVAAGERSTLEATAVVRVMGGDDAPPASFYEGQQVVGGYGYIETRDGTTLAINVLLPGPIDRGPYPTVIEYSGYEPANPTAPQPSMQIAAALGYAAVGVNMRGTGCSGGAFRYFETLQSTDGYDAVEIIAAQPWVKRHKVGMVGISYPGISQLFVAQLQPPHLAAIAPLSVISDTGRGVLYPGGILNNGFATSWAADRDHDSKPFGQAWSKRRMEVGDTTCIANQRLRGQTPDIFKLISDNPYYTDDVAAPLSPATFVDRITVPVFLAGAWQDEQVGGYFATMLDRFTGTDKAHFTLTNGGHTDSLGPAIFSRWTEFLSFYVAETIPRLPAGAYLTLQVVGQQVFGVSGLTLEPDRFLDAPSFEAARAQFEAESRVRVLFENGAGRIPGAPVPRFEHGFDEWPPAAVEPTTWYFAKDGQLQPVPPTDSGVDAYVYDPSRAQSTTFHGSDTDVWKALPAWDWPSPVEGTALAYATTPLAETLVMTGSGSVDLWLQSSAADTDLQVTLSEIRPDGFETYVQSGWLRASQRKTDPGESSPLRPAQTHREEDAAPLPAGEFVEARVELFPFAHVFRAGSSVRLIVEAPGASRPRWKFDALVSDGIVTNTISRSAAKPSRVVLPVLPGVEVPAELPACPSLRGQPCRSFTDVENTSR